MKSTEFTNEGVDRTVDDVKANHPEIYEFFKRVGAWMSFDHYGQVESYDTANSHMVSIKMKPSAGISNTKANMEAQGIGYESMSNPMGGGEVLSGNEGEMYWSVKADDVRGNATETWLFTFPLAEEETVEEGGFFKGIGQKIVNKADAMAVNGLVKLLDSGTNKMELYANFTQMHEYKQKNLLDAIGRWLEHNDHKGVADFYNLHRLQKQ